MPALDLIRPARSSDLIALTHLYNHYIVETPITFDLKPWTPDERKPWFEAHAEHGPHRLIVAELAGQIVGYASTSRFRPKAAYDTTVETSVYCRAASTGHGIGTALYRALFEAVRDEDIHRFVAGVTLPNPASVALHTRFGFRQIGLLTEVGRKFGQYWNVAWFERPAS
jgi:phosphinothricin acetyltransferase